MSQLEGIRVARRGKSNVNARKADQVMDTRLLTLPIAKRIKGNLSLDAGTLYGFTGIAFPIVSLPHGMKYTPLFRAWVESVNRTTGGKTGKKLSVPVIDDGIVYWLTADGTNIYLNVSITGASYTPATRLSYDFYIYIFDSRYFQ